MKNPMYDVVIVGGGLSGMRLAALLQAQGTNYLLLEARPRVGGRILSEPLVGNASATPHRYDLGPSWIWPQQPRINELAKEMGIKRYPQFDQGTLVYQDQFGAINATIDAAPMSGSIRLEGGLQSLIDGLYSRLETDRVWLNHCVNNVTLEDTNEAPRHVRIDCESATGKKNITTRKLVLCAPPRVVEKLITFSPKLSPAQNQALLNMPTWMAGQCKVTAVYETPFWRTQGLSGDGMSRLGPLGEIHDASPEDQSQGALFGFVAWPAQQRQEAGDQLIPYVIKQLQQLFGPQAAAPLQVQVQDWATQTYTATQADTHTSPSQSEFGLPIALEQVWQDCLLFACAEMAYEFGGVAEGALEAAEVAFGSLNSSVD
jgi:monoamine oxidase